MPGEIFYWLLNMSVTASVAGVLVLLIRSIKRIPRRVICFFWAIPALRMLLPFGISGKYGLMSLLSQYIYKTEIVYLDPDHVISASNSIQLANGYFPFIFKTNLLEDVFNVAFSFWSTVAAALIMLFVLLYITTLRELRGAEHMYGNVYASEKITSPALYGIFRPRIIIPAAMRGSDLTFILLHERTHMKRADNFWRMAAFLTVSLHWFNPLSWVFLRCFLNDIELACDEKVLSKCGEEQKKEYALSLVDAAKSKSVFASAFGGAKIRTRIENILSYKKMTVFSAVSFAILLAASAYFLLTNAV